MKYFIIILILLYSLLFPSSELKIVKNDSTGTQKIIFNKIDNYNDLHTNGKGYFWIKHLDTFEDDSITMNVFNDTLGFEYSQTYHYSKKQTLSIDFKDFFRRIPVADSNYIFYINFLYHGIASDTIKRTINLNNFHKVDSADINKDPYCTIITISKDSNKLVYIKNNFPDPFSPSSRITIHFDKSISLLKNDSLFIEFYDENLNFVNKIKIDIKENNQKNVHFDKNLIDGYIFSNCYYFKIKYKDYYCPFKSL